MPGECGAHEWFTMKPPLVSGDHVHFTAAGYRRSANEFLAALIPIAEQARAGADVIPHD
jgi:lysophospholipase L1-like esterase